MSPSRYLRMPKLAYRDPEFVESLAARPLRILAEYLDPLTRMRREKVGDTIVMFGSARILPRDRAQAQVRKLQKKGRRVRTGALREKLRAARSDLEMSRYYEEARELARRITAWSMTLGTNPRRFVICSGGGPGIMEAANRGAALAGGRSIGLNISLPQEQRPNPYVTPELCFEFHYFFMRKLWFAHLAHALIAFPGGFGTLDELFEILTLAQTRKLDRSIPVLLYGSAYWREVINFEALVRHGTIAAEDLQLFEFVDEPHAAFERLRARISLPPAPQPAFAKSRCNPNA
jgi:uncharacterized protein (TIGR00730 family)